MRTLQEIMFPHLADKRWRKVDLDFAARGEKRPESHIIKTICDDLKIDYPYGGWLEDRSSLWHDKYMMKENPPRPIHLGMDFWVPAGTAVNMPWPGETIHAYHDEDQDGGWGGRVTFYNRMQMRQQNYRLTISMPSDLKRRMVSRVNN